MRKLFTVIWLLCSALCFAGEAKLGSYIVVRGAVQGCEAWTDRILDIVEIESDEYHSILGLPGLAVLGRNEAEITTSILDTIERETGTRPQTLLIELIDSEQEFEMLLVQYRYSLNQFIKGRCPRERKRRPYFDLEEQIDKIRREELSRSVV